MKVNVIVWGVLVSALSFFVAMNAEATNKRDLIEYKCHFELAGNKHVIKYVVSKAKHPKAVALEMSKKPIFAKNGVSRLGVRKVVQCVGAKDSFKAVESQQLDQVTLS